MLKNKDINFIGFFELNGTHYHNNETITIQFKWNDSFVERNNCKVFLFDPQGNSKEINIKDENKDFCNVSFIPDSEGYYQLVLKQNTHFAKAVIPVGHHLHHAPTVLDNTLELSPVLEGQLKAGDTINIKALFENNILANKEIILTYQGPLDPIKPIVEKTSSQGIANFKLPQPGKYLIITENENYSETLPLLVVKK